MSRTKRKGKTHHYLCLFEYLVTQCYRSVLSCPLGRGCVRVRAGESILDIVGKTDIEKTVLKLPGTSKKLRRRRCCVVCEAMFASVDGVIVDVDGGGIETVSAA